MNFEKKCSWRRVVWLLFIVSPDFAWKWCLSGYFSGAFNALYVHQIWQHLNQNDHLTPLYPRVWHVQAEWHNNGPDGDLKWPTQTALNCQIWQFMMSTLNQRLRSFPTESRTEIFPNVDKITLFLIIFLLCSLSLSLSLSRDLSHATLASSWTRVARPSTLTQPTVVSSNTTDLSLSLLLSPFITGSQHCQTVTTTVGCSPFLLPFSLLPLLCYTWFCMHEGRGVTNPLS